MGVEMDARSKFIEEYVRKPESEMEKLNAELAALRSDNERLRDALSHVAYGGNFTCFVDNSWEIVNEALK